MVMCLGRGANLHMAQLMPLPLTISPVPVNSNWYIYLPCFTFLVPANHIMVVVVVVKSMVGFES